MTNYHIFITILIIYQHFDMSFSLCAMYGVCHETAAYFNYCPADNETIVPRPLPEESGHLEERLKMKCPYLFADGNRDLCCDPPQVEALFKMISTATSLFSRCPSCMDNFWKYWCMYTCSPTQKHYLEVLETEPSPTTSKEMVIKVRYNLSRQYAENTYESCRNVKMSSGSGNVMSLMMCGRLSSNETCTLEKWLNFMGTRSHGLGIPVDVIHSYHDANQSGNYMDMNTSRCDQSPRVGQSKCMEMDCPLTARRAEFVLEGNLPQEPCKLFGIGCSLYFLVFSVVIFIGVLTWAFLPHVLEQSQEYEGTIQSETSISSQAHWIPNQTYINSELFVEFVSKQPCLTILSGVFLAIICSTGLLFMTVTSNPLDVWVPPNSRAIQEKEFFDSHFGPFYRVEQVILYPKPGKIKPISNKIGPVFQKSFMREVFQLVNSIRQLSATLADGRKVLLDDICYRPMGTGYDCLINSPTNYFNHNISLLDEEVFYQPPAKDVFDDYDEEVVEARSITYLDHIMDCIQNPYTLNSSFERSCLGPYGGPTFTSQIFGNENHDENVLNSTAVIITIPLSSRADNVKMRAWERSFIKYLRKYKNDKVQLSFMAERSIQDEIKRASESDATTISIALLLMILYSIFALGRYTVENNRLFSILIHSKIVVGICGMLSIATAIASSLGIMSFYGLNIPSAAIVMNSFVTLLIGCNRIFAVVWTSRKEINKESYSIVCAFKTSLPSAFMCTLVQSIVFFTGALISVPAVRSFCLLSSLSIVLQLFFLCVMFLPICIMDIRREKRNRPEFCCFSLETSSKIERTPNYNNSSYVSHRGIQIFTIILTLIVLLALPWASARIKLGLDQKLAVPTDSYMYTHFKNIDKYLNTGPPVYFVVHGDIDFSQRKWQNKFCSLGGCSDNSIGGILSQAVVNSERSYISGETFNWVDNYLEWLAPESQCCKVLSSSATVSTVSSSLYCRNNDHNCTSCDTFNADGRPTESVFYRHLPQFLEDVPGPQCVKGGRAAFHHALHLDPSGHVDASHFMTFHVPLRNSTAYIEAMNSARLIAQKMEEELGDNVTVFPYTIFYVFYEQFSTIRTVSAYQLIFAFTAIFLGVFILIGFDALLAFIMIFVCSFQLICQIIFMALWNIDLNSISAVNLVLAVAICVESCLPILMAYYFSTAKNTILRVEEAAATVSPSSLCGLTVPMTLGTVMLTFAQSPFFNVYFFRMLIVTALSCCFSGLLLLPVLLILSSYFKRKEKKFSVISQLSASTGLHEENHPIEMQFHNSAVPLLNTVL